METMLHLVIFLLYQWSFLTAAQDPFIWPLPMEYSVSNELSVSISNSFTMKQTNSNSNIITNAINRYMKLIFPHKPDNTPPSKTNPISTLNINIADGGSNTTLQYGMDETYQLKFPNSANEGQLNTKTIWGALRGLETLSQIIIYNYTAGYYQSYTADINDAPRFKWRGMLIDTSRHFESVSTIKNVIDSLSYAKYNTLHWHIIDSPSFPYQCKIYDQLWNGAYTEYERYSQNDIKEIIDYGYERGIRIVPEFDMPGHSHSWCAGYPEICPISSCNDEKKKNGKPSNGVLNPAVNMTYKVISGLIAESTGLFIDDYVHLGGDEVNTTCWSVDSNIQKWMKQNNFNETDAEWYFDEKVQNITFYDNGKQVINWVEVFNLFGDQLDGRQKFVTIQVWKAEETLLNVVAAGFKAILADSDCWYLNNINIPWQKAYLNEPYKGIDNVEQQKLILGGEGSVWGENVDESDMENTLWPRAAAIAERLWSPQNVNDTNKAEPRYAYFRCLLNSRGIAAAPYNNTVARSQPIAPGSCYNQSKECSSKGTMLRSLSHKSTNIYKSLSSTALPNLTTFNRHNISTTSNPFNGVWPIIATPFNSNETIDYKSFEKIINFFSNEIGVNGCTIIGVLGESNRLIDEERKELISIATSISSKPICVGTSHSGTYATIKLSEQAINCSAQSVMITPSKEPVPDQSTIVNYYKQIYNTLGDEVPIVLQDHPASTMVHMTMDTMKTIITNCPSVKCIKLESLPSPVKIRNIVPWIKENKYDVTILTGLGALYGLFDLECDTNGFMTGFAFPEILYKLYEEQIVKQHNFHAKLLFQKYLPLMVFEQQPGVAIRKEIYKLRGLMDSTHCRHPGKNSSPDAVNQLKDWIGFIIGENVDLTKPLSVDVPKSELKK